MGVINTFIDLAVLNLLIVVTDTGRRGAWYAVFKGIAVFCALLNSYTVNGAWTFRKTGRRRTALEAGEFLLVSAVGAVVNVGSSFYVASFIRPMAGFDTSWPSVAALVGTICSLGFNFVGYKYIVFSQHRARHYPES